MLFSLRTLQGTTAIRRVLRAPVRRPDIGGGVASMLCLAVLTVLPALGGCCAMKICASKSCTCGSVSCTECCPNPYQREAAQALAESGLLSGVSDSYRAGFVDGFGDHMGAQDRREWAAGFQHGYDAAHRSTEPAYSPDREDATSDIWDEPLPGFEDGLAPVLDRSDLPPATRGPDEVVGPQRNVPTPAVPPTTVPDDAMPPMDVPFNDPLEIEPGLPAPSQPRMAPSTGPSTGPATILDGPSTDQSQPMMRNPMPEDATPFMPPPAPPARQPEAAPTDDLQLNEPLPAEPESRPSDSELDFDDLFADPDADSTGALPSPSGRSRDMASAFPGAQQNAPKMTIRFKDEKPPSRRGRREGPSPPGTSRAVSFEAPVEKPRTSPQGPARTTSRSTPTGSPFSQHFQTPPVSTASRLKNASEGQKSTYKSQFTVDQDQAVIIEDE